MATGARTFVDTDILIGVARGNSRAVKFWQRREVRTTILCSVVTVLELLAGCRNLREQRSTVRSFKNIDRVHIESSDSLNALQWYQDFHLSRGVGMLDCFIAAAASRLDCILYTLNTKHFRAIPGLRVKRPY